jgi:hypothetical protein
MPASQKKRARKGFIRAPLESRFFPVFKKRCIKGKRSIAARPLGATLTLVLSELADCRFVIESMESTILRRFTVNDVLKLLTVIINEHVFDKNERELIESFACSARTRAMPG